MFPLRDWITGDAAAADNFNSGEGQRQKRKSNNESMIRRATVAYGVVELLLHHPNYDENLDDGEIIKIDNFLVDVCKNSATSWDNIRGVKMLSSGLSLKIEEPSYLSCLDDEQGDESGHMGRCLEVELDTTNLKKDNHGNTEEIETINTKHRHHLVAKNLFELFAQEKYPIEAEDEVEPAQKKAKKSQLWDQKSKGDVGDQSVPDIFSLPVIKRMHQLGVPSSICRIVQHLLEDGGDAYNTLKEVSEDLHLSLFDPDRFLFDQEVQSPDSLHLFSNREKLYGRDKEETLITDTFCRVTRGRSEAFFIGGFSGCGKSMLVDKLSVRVKNVGGYVIKHKFDALSQDRPLSGVISAVNQLCLMMKRTMTSQRLNTLSEQIKNDFGADIGLLARMLPNICELSSEFSNSVGKEEIGNSSDKMDARSVSFTLMRLIRLVSTPQRPIMLFLDDLQWADETVFDVVHTFLSDTMGICMLFVGTYRDNEVQSGHAIFDLFEKLGESNVPTTKVSLTGLDQTELNRMISDALHLYPRICKSLSEIVFQKTEGNPFFVFEFMQSLQSRGLLFYDFSQRRWMWNDETIRAEEITDNVLHLLSSKMSGLSKDKQLLLKVMACFGTFTNDCVLTVLGKSSEYAGLRRELKGAINDGFVEATAERKLKFVHDKIREAAYHLIPDNEKKQLHLKLGRTLYSNCEGIDQGDAVFVIASQINHGLDLLDEEDELLRMPVADLNIKAGEKALDGCDHKTAYFYFIAALSLLPDDNWESHYDLSLRLNFFMARASFSTCKYSEAELILHTICEKARCLHDKLAAYVLLGEIFLAEGHAKKAYDTCSSILTQLGEAVPEKVTLETVGIMIPETLKMYSEVYGDDWLEKKMEDVTLCNVIKFYSIIATAAFFCKSSHMGAYFVCKMVQLSFKKGICKHTPLAFMQLSSIVINFENAPSVYEIAKNAMSLSEKFGLSDEMTELCVNYYMGAGHLDSYRSGAKQLRKGFASGLSFGNVNTAFYCAGQGAYFSVISAEKDLSSLLQEIDYYLHLLETYKSEMTKKYFLCIRETVSTLIDRGEETSILAKLSQADVSDQENKLLEMFYFHQVFRNYWLGYGERCHYYVQKCLKIFKPGKFNIYVIKFYHGLNSLDMLKKKANFTKSSEVDDIIASIRTAALHSDSNFRNKLDLLEAEQFGLSVNHNQVVAFHAYDTAIASAVKAEFIHEQGLACEKAGFYSKRVRNTEKSLFYYKQARECYQKWGSSVKVLSVQRELDNLSSPMVGD